MRSALTRARSPRYRLRVYIALFFVASCALWINSNFVSEFVAANEAHDDASPHVEDETYPLHGASLGARRSTRWHISVAEMNTSDLDKNVVTPSPEDPTQRSEWLHNISRGKTLDMYNLTQLNDCKRLPSWRANEKRFIRLQNDRNKARNCVQTSGLQHSQLFGVRTVADTKPYSHRQYSGYRHAKDQTPPDTPRLLRVAQLYVLQHLGDIGNHVDSQQETERLFSIASIAQSDAFLWKEAAPTDAFDPEGTGDVGSIEALIQSGRLRVSPVRGRFHRRLEINPDALDECHFSKKKSLSHADLDPFSLEGYHLVQFLFEETFLRHGWITVPVAGTALGTLRHHGMFRGDDDMDMTTYPAAKHLLLDSAWGSLFDDFDDIVESYGEDHPNFTWFKSNDYRYHGPWFTRNDKKKRLPTYPFSEYEQHVRQDGRVCFAQYMTWNATEKRRLFQTEGCTPNHWFLCLQPSSYIYDRHDELFERHVIQDVHDIFIENRTLLPGDLDSIGPMVFTAYHRRPAKKLCKCKFGFLSGMVASATPSFGLCFDNMHDFVQYWYDGKWCVPSGAVRTRKWSFLKSWND